MSEILNTLIIGSGPAGYTAAIYACRAQLEPVLVCGSEVGGQLTTTPEIENWPSRFDAPDGFSLMQDMSKHAEKLGTKFIYDEVVKTDFSKNVKEVYLSSGTVLKAKTVIIATGAKARYLGLESETKYKGKGVSACATCDGFFFRGKEVAVVGGGSAAFIEALYLANLCSKVYLIHRRAEFRAEKVLVDRLRKLEIEGKVEFVLNANIKEILGDGNLVNGVKVQVNGENRDIALSGVFMAIGHEPSTKPFAGQIELYDDGTVKTGFTSETSTSVAGVFAAGDCADRIYRQAITSAGQGCKAALDAELERKSEKIENAMKNAGLNVNRVGSIMTAFFTDKKVVDYDTATTADTKRYAEYYNHLLENGIYAAPSQFEAMFVSFAHTEDDIEKTCQVIESFK